MRRIQSSYKAIFVIFILLANSLILIPNRVSGQSNWQESKLAPDVLAKVNSYKSQHILSPEDGVFDLLDELLSPITSNNQSSHKTAEVSRLIIQTTEATNESDIQMVESFGGRVLNPSLHALNGMVIELPDGAIEEFAAGERVAEYRWIVRFAYLPVRSILSKKDLMVIVVLTRPPAIWKKRPAHIRYIPGITTGTELTRPILASLSLIPG